MSKNTTQGGTFLKITQKKNLKKRLISQKLGAEKQSHLAPNHQANRTHSDGNSRLRFGIEDPHMALLIV